MWGERVNLREQHDAFEFFNCLVDSLDEGLKAYGSLAVLSKILGGSFADQKICKGCPHRLVQWNDTTKQLTPALSSVGMALSLGSNLV